MGLASFANSRTMHEDAIEAGNLAITIGDVRRDGIDHAIDRALDHVSHCDALVIDCDVDVIDRPQFPAAPGGRAGGLAVHDFFHAVRRLAADSRVRVIDLTEWDPPLDPTDLSALTAGRWFAECLAGYEMRSLATSEASLRDKSDSLEHSIAQRSEMEKRLVQSQKLEAVGQLAGGVAHDFNNILGVIIGYGEALLSRAETDSAIAENLSEILKAAGRGTGLISQLLAFSRKQVTWPRIIDVNATIIDIDKILHRIAGEDIYFTLLLGPEAGCVKGEPGQIEQVIVNLVVNARLVASLLGRALVSSSSLAHLT